MKLRDKKEIDIINNGKLKIYIVESNIDLYNEIARVMINTIKENNNKDQLTSFILPVGPRGQYERFVRICNNEKISCKNLLTINMDEYLGNDGKLIPEDHPLSFRYFMKKNFFDALDYKIKIKPENIFFPDPENLKLIEGVIKEIGGIDICFGGVGINGHIAFNEPIGENLINNQEFKELRTRILKLSFETIIINSISYGGNLDLIPKNCITLGIKEIFSSQKLRFYLEHDWQSVALEKIIYLEPSHFFPASYLKEHRDVILTVSRNVLKNFSNLKIQNKNDVLN